MNDVGREDLIRAEDHQLLACHAEPSARVPATKGALGAGGYGTARGDVGVVAFDLRLASLDPGHPERVAHEHLAQQELGAAAHVGNAASSNKTSAPRHTRTTTEIDRTHL